MQPLFQSMSPCAFLSSVSVIERDGLVIRDASPFSKVDSRSTLFGRQTEIG